ncbi:MAG: HU family DNA-binding protein [Anaerolineae bacterium]|nr:HU family DNA-binding protein [Anaerolineae bacterium]
MNHRQTIAEISKRLPRLKRRDVAEVLEVMAELWTQELSNPGQTVTVADLGKLVIEVQTFRSGGAVRQRLQQLHGSKAPKTLKRLYVRFRPTAKFRQVVIATYINEGEDE